eukprot:212507-Rhodomonas_salina.1
MTDCTELDLMQHSKERCINFQTRILHAQHHNEFIADLQDESYLIPLPNPSDEGGNSEDSFHTIVRIHDRGANDGGCFMIDDEWEEAQ